MIFDTLYRRVNTPKGQAYGSAGLLTVVFLVSAVFQYLTLPNMDVAWYALLAAKMQLGAVPYQDFVEPNPPMVLWLYSLPVWVAGHFDYPPVLFIKAFAIGLIALTLACSAKILRRSSVWQGTTGYSMLVAIAAALLLSGDNYWVFAQREHLLVILLLPYLLLRLPSITHRMPRALEYGAGLLAALGLCLKPYFFLIPALAFVFRWYQTRRFFALIGRAELTIIAATLGYIAAVLIFTPHYLESMKLLSKLYGAHGVYQWSLAHKIVWIGTYGVLGCVIAWLLSIFNGERDTAYLGVIALAAYLQALVQFKPWLYIPYPFVAFGAIAVAAAILTKPVKHFAAVLLMAALFYPTPPWSDFKQKNITQKNHALAEAVAPFQQKASNYVLSLEYESDFLYRSTPPLVWTNRFSSLYFMLAGIMEPSAVSGQPTFKVKPGMEWAERWLRDAIAHDLNEKKPELLITVRRWYDKESVSDSFDFSWWLERDAKTAKALRHYTLSKEQIFLEDSGTRHALFQFYVRKK